MDAYFGKGRKCFLHLCNYITSQYAYEKDAMKKEYFSVLLGEILKDREECFDKNNIFISRKLKEMEKEGDPTEDKLLDTYLFLLRELEIEIPRDYFFEKIRNMIFSLVIISERHPQIAMKDKSQLLTQRIVDGCLSRIRKSSQEVKRKEESMNFTFFPMNDNFEHLFMESNYVNICTCLKTIHKRSQKSILSRLEQK